MITGMKETVKEAIAEAIAETFAGAFTHVLVELMNAAYILVLIGGTICIVLYVAGWEKGMKYAGIMFVSYVILRAVLGGINV